MKNAFKKLSVALMLAALVLVPLSSAQASNLVSNVPTVGLSMTVSETLSVSASPASITFTYASGGGGTATASGSISVTTNYSLAGTRGQLYTFEYFSSQTALTNGTGGNIPTTNVFASINGGTATACTGSAPVTYAPAAAGTVCPMVFNGTSILTGGTFVGTNTGTVLLSMSGLGAVNPGTYSGTLNIVSLAV
ncbi:MAG TPA: hypothetical protein VNV41_16395 [Candidatus Acidoferrales bacterium]|jgi:hypothetical protein|nr:hypothetical protein [Candidatus Acidoferrales bacterium]